MSGAINYRLKKDIKRVIDADVSKEIVDYDKLNDIDVTRTYELVLNMSKEEVVAVVAAAVKKYPFVVYRTLALYAERGKDE